MNPSLTTIIAINALIGLIWLLVMAKMDSHAGKHRSILDRLLFLLVGFLSVPLVFVMYHLAEFGPFGRLDKIFNNTGQMIGEQLLVVGPVEEFSKFAIFFGLSSLFRTVRDPRDGILQAATVGLAFALVENIQYSQLYGLDVLWYRGFFCIAGHMSLAAMWGFVFAYTRFAATAYSHRQSLGICLLALLPASFIHGLGNLLMLSPWSGLSTMLDFGEIGLAAWLYHLAAMESPFHPFPIAEWRRAVGIIRRSLVNQPENPDLYQRCGFYLLYGKQYAAAVQNFTHCLKLQPKNHFTRIFLGISQILAGSPDKGIAEAERGLLATMISWRRVRTAICRFVIDPKDQATVLELVLTRTLLENAQSSGRP